MLEKVIEGFSDYTLLDSGEGMRLEKVGPYRISRPDPQAMWSRTASPSEWSYCDATFVGGRWVKKPQLPHEWNISYKELRCIARLTPFKHTGFFPEQSVMWDLIGNVLHSAKRRAKVLNLFGYTGMASIASARAGAHVTHVDASKPSITWARENMLLSGLPSDSIRWILDDAAKFVKREVRREARYDGIILDPPVYGHGPKGELWDFFKHFPLLMKDLRSLLTDKPLFVIVNAYAVTASSVMLGNMLEDLMKGLPGKIEYGELCLRESIGKRLLSTGIYGTWQANT